jgi:CRISPR-associated protein Cmr4
MIYENKRYFAMALDPIHVGTGGYRLGRVDLSIIREPGTDIPKIPGTSINGVVRAYSAMQQPGKYPGCAGQKDHCCNSDCPVCIAFGFASNTSAFQGLAQLSDARILFFPVHSIAGPVWITSPSILSEFNITEGLTNKYKIKTSTMMSFNGERLNLGWLMLQREGDFTIPDDELGDVPSDVKNRTILVSDKLFAQIVNDNLEVRTSVSIDPATGAAEEGALFTYEAIPRTTHFWLDVVYSDPSLYKVNNQAISLSISDIQQSVESGLKLIEHLGLGGMNTRGMGRMRILNI